MEEYLLKGHLMAKDEINIIFNIESLRDHIVYRVS